MMDIQRGASDMIAASFDGSICMISIFLEASISPLSAIIGWGWLHWDGVGCLDGVCNK